MGNYSPSRYSQRKSLVSSLFLLLLPFVSQKRIVEGKSSHYDDNDDDIDAKLFVSLIAINYGAHYYISKLIDGNEVFPIALSL